MKTPRFRRMLLASSLVVGAAAPVFADGFAIEKSSVPIPFLTADSAKVDGVIEASAIEAIGDGSLLLVAHDKTAEMFVVETATGRLVGKSLTTPRFPNEAKIAPKWEGLASDSQGFYYVIGTHSGKTDEDRPSRSYLFRFRLTGGTQGSPVAIDETSVSRFRIEKGLKSALGLSVSDSAEVDKRKIEGLAVRELRANGDQPARMELVIGLREPGDLVRAFAADITKTPADGAELTLTPMFEFDAGEREGVRSQLTSLEYVAQWQGFVVTTATEDKQNVFHGNTLWFVSDAQVAAGKTVKPDVIDIFEPAMKVEGIAVIPEAGRGDSNAVRFALGFDNDPHTTHIPSRLQQVVITKRSER